MKIGQYVSDNVVSTSNWSNVGRLSRRAGLSAIAGLSCLVMDIDGHGKKRSQGHRISQQKVSKVGNGWQHRLFNA